MSAVLEFPVIADEAAPAAQPEPKETGTDLALIVSTEVAEFTETEKGLIDLHQRLHGIAYADLQTVKGMEAAIADRRELIDLRVGVGKLAKALNTKDRTEYEARRDKRLVGAEKLQGIVLALETPIDEQIKAEEARKERVRLEKVAKEKERTDAHEARLAVLRGYVGQAAGKTAAQIASGILAVEAIVIDPDAWEEYAERAELAKLATLASLVNLHDKAKASEEAAAEADRQRAEQARIAEAQRIEAKRLKDEAEALAKQQREAAAALAAQQAEIDRQRAELEALRNVAAPAPAPAQPPEPAPATPAPEPVESAPSEPESAAPASADTGGTGAAVDTYLPSDAMGADAPVGRAFDAATLAEAEALARDFGARQIGPDVWVFDSMAQIAALIDAARG